jgi:hypothetical protein
MGRHFKAPRPRRRLPVIACFSGAAPVRFKQLEIAGFYRFY